jgi:Calcineurin-like phosphoesterase/Iron/zinc purple acid phosphatase-like protein C
MSTLSYHLTDESNRNFTAFQHRFNMAGDESGGVGNFWYSFDYGLAHFISFDSETDFAYSPEWPFVRDDKSGASLPTEAQTRITDSGPFGTIDGNNWKDNSAYQQIKWLESDLKAINRTKTPWVVAMSHRPMYSTLSASYQPNVRAAFESLFLEYKVDIYLAGHIHWYERLLPLGTNGTIDTDSIIDKNTYYTGTGKSLTHLINGMAGNIESHTTLAATEPIKNITAVLDQKNYGFSKLTFQDETTATWTFVKGDGTGSGDELTLKKKV